MKNLVTFTALALLMASPAFAGSVTGEVRFSDPRTGSAGTADANEYRLEYRDTLGDVANYGLELATKQPEDAGNVTSKIVGKLGPALPEIAGFRPAVYGEFGQALGEDDNYNFWGLGTNVSRSVYGPVSASVGYRYRVGFDQERMEEHRYDVGLRAKITDNWGVGTNYYWTRGSADSEAVGVSVIRSF